MNNELSQRLRHNYPKIFDQPCEISCADGWFGILDSLCGCIQSHIDHRNQQWQHHVRFTLMLEALVAGDDTQFREWFQHLMPPEQEKRRQSFLAGENLPPAVSRCEQIVARQIKEKFGTLRFYVDSGPDDVVQGMIQMAEAMSAVTCEVCGSPGTTRGGGWVMTLCALHEAERQR